MEVVFIIYIYTQLIFIYICASVLYNNSNLSDSSLFVPRKENHSSGEPYNLLVDSFIC